MARSKEYLMRVCKEFFNVEKIIEIRELSGGHINETYEVIFKDYRYVLQQLNSVVFFSPLGVMNNIRLVTDHIKKKVVYEGKNPKRSVLTLIKTRYDQDIAIVDNEYWRCVEYIDGGVGYDLVPDAKTFYEVGRAVGNFQNLLSDFHTRLIDDPIKNFHDTPKRYENFLRVIKVDEFSRVSECEKEIKMYIGDELQVMPKVEPESTIWTFNYSSNNKNIVSVNNDGVIKALSEGETYVVEGPYIEKLLRHCNFEDAESMQYFQLALRRKGIIDALEEKGIQEGDTVVIYDLEFDFVP